MRFELQIVVPNTVDISFEEAVSDADAVVMESTLCRLGYIVEQLYGSRSTMTFDVEGAVRDSYTPSENSVWPSRHGPDQILSEWKGLSAYHQIIPTNVKSGIPRYLQESYGGGTEQLLQAANGLLRNDNICWLSPGPGNLPDGSPSGVVYPRLAQLDAGDSAVLIH